MGASGFLLRSLLNRRRRQGKEDPARLGERMGVPGKARPAGPLVWFHAASVGESQSTLILIDALLGRYPGLNVLVTTGTVTSAALMEKRLPPQAIHQYYPLDHPGWVDSFLSHWWPDLALWMESEIWPNMLGALKKHKIPAAIVNGRLSPQSFRRWKLAGKEIGRLLETFSVCLAQTEEDAASFRALGMTNVSVSDNLKYSAAALPVNERDLKQVKDAAANRPLWLFASTHYAEEEMACRIHRNLQQKIPSLLTIIVPRHAERREAISMACEKYGLRYALRSGGQMPGSDCQIYIADTLGELGLFYRLCPIACIGRSFSNDGGGGHNPIEAAQLGCAVLHGPLVQNLAQIYAEFDEAGAAVALEKEQDFQDCLGLLLTDGEKLKALQNRAAQFAAEKAKVLDTVMATLAPLLQNFDKNSKSQKCA